MKRLHLTLRMIVWILGGTGLPGCLLTRENSQSEDTAREVAEEEKTTDEDQESRGSKQNGATVARVRLNSGDDPSIGPDDAPVTVLEFIDYECPFCVRAHSTVEELMDKYPDNLRFVFKQLPLKFHHKALQAARAALAADAQGSFRQIHDILLTNSPALKEPDLKDYASQIGLNAEDFEFMITSEFFDPKIQADLETARQIGVTAIPFFFINGRPLRGVKPLSVFEDVIQEELGGNVRLTRWVTTVHEAESSFQREAGPRSGGVMSQAKELTEVRNDVRILKRELAALKEQIAELTHLVMHHQMTLEAESEREHEGIHATTSHLPQAGGKP